MIKSIKGTCILINDTNTSDHLAISLTVKAQAKSNTVPEAKINYNELQWKKADLGLYRHVLSVIVSVYNPNRNISVL